MVEHLRLDDLVVEPEDITEIGEFNVFRFRAKGVFDDMPRYYYSHKVCEGLKRRSDNEQVYMITRERYDDGCSN